MPSVMGPVVRLGGRSPALATVLALAMSGCGGAGAQPWTPPGQRDGHEDPSQLRPGYGSAQLHTWWPLTEPEVAALAGVDKAREGDPHALLALAILASADHRDAASFAGYQQRLDRFVADVRPTIEGAPDDWHRGYELNRAMHRVFSGAEHGELGSYELNQSRVTGIFDGGRYNCISSAMLFTVLARAFGLPVRGVVVPTHAFVEMGAPGGKILEVETTSDKGFDWVHDARFYRDGAAQWSSQRGLRPVTLDDYEKRQILEPYRFMARGMQNQMVYERGDQDRGRLAEASTVVDPDDPDAQTARVQAYLVEAKGLWERKAARTIVRMFEVVGPAVTDISSRRAKDAKTMDLVAWAGWFYADSLEVVGRGDEAVAMADSVLDHLDDGWEDAGKLRQNFMNVYDNHMLELMNKKDYAASVRVTGKHFDACLCDKICASNVSVVYGNWSIDYQNAGDWQGARRVLQECVTRLPGDAPCSDALRDLESRHRF
jgi:hypothetical protein